MSDFCKAKERINNSGSLFGFRQRVQGRSLLPVIRILALAKFASMQNNAMRDFCKAQERVNNSGSLFGFRQRVQGRSLLPVIRILASAKFG